MPQKFISIKNFEKFQNYKNRNPPWIRLYYAILDDPAFLQLEEVHQCRLFKLFMIASKQNNRILDDPYYLARLMRIDGPVDITPLIRSGFVLAECKRRAGTMLHKNAPEPEADNSEADNSEAEQMRVRAFEEFWKHYPLKVGKDRAEKAWFKLNGSCPSLDLLLEALERHKQSEQWMKDEGKYIPHASTWLNGKRWKDEITVVEDWKRDFLQEGA